MSEAGHSEVVGELLQKYGIKGCGGASGVVALSRAAASYHVDITRMLTSVGVVDTGIALLIAIACGRESSVKFLLRQHQFKASGDGAGYLNTHDGYGMTPLGNNILDCKLCSLSQNREVARGCGSGHVDGR